MGHWAKRLFGKESFGNIGIVLAGTIKPKFEKRVLALFDEVISSEDAVYHGHLVKKDNRLIPLVTNVYGAPAMMDVMTEMHDGGCQTIIFIGYAYGGFKNLNVGEVVITDKAYHFDGIYHALKIDKKATHPDKELKEKVKRLLNENKIDFKEGTDISVPAVTFQPKHTTYKEIKPITLEMELAACLARAKDIGIRAVGILIISDNRKASLGDQTQKMLRAKQKEKVIKTIVKNLDSFTLPHLKVKKEFLINEHLASIIEDPEDKTNVYKN